MSPFCPVYLVDDDAAVRSSLTWLLEEAGFTLQSFASAAEFLATVDLASTGCLLLDICMPSVSGTELQEELARRGCALAVVFLTGEADVSTTAQVFRRGAFDLLEKTVAPEVLLATVQRAVAASETAHANTLAALALRECLSALSPREAQILWAVFAGLANKQIAEQLHIALRTVEIHRHNMMQKMGVQQSLALIQALTRHEAELRAWQLWGAN
ncbi:MAG: response regulator transcription factor [Aeromonas sp.]